VQTDPVDTDLSADIGRRRARAGRIAIILGVVVVVLFVILMSIDIAAVHSESGEWRLWPTAAPPKVVFRGHDYGDRRLVAHRDPAATHVGTTAGGGGISATTTSKTAAPGVIWIRDGTATYEYSLVSGS